MFDFKTEAEKILHLVTKPGVSLSVEEALTRLKELHEAKLLETGLFSHCERCGEVRQHYQGVYSAGGKKIGSLCKDCSHEVLGWVRHQEERK